MAKVMEEGVQVVDYGCLEVDSQQSMIFCMVAPEFTLEILRFLVLTVIDIIQNVHHSPRRRFITVGKADTYFSCLPSPFFLVPC